MAMIRKPLIAAAALFLCLTPALAQSTQSPDQPEQSPADQAEQAPIDMASQPDSGQPGLSQAGALAAAQAEAQASEEQYSAAKPTVGPPLGEQPTMQPDPQQDVQSDAAQQYPPQGVQGPQPSMQQDAEAPSGESAAPGTQSEDAAPPADAMQPSLPPRPTDANEAAPPYTGAPSADAIQPYPPAPSAEPFPEQRSARGGALEAAPAIRPRAEAAAYPVYRQQQQFSVGARLLSAKEVERRFSTPLGKHYLVVEVGLFPADMQTVNLRPEDFTLRMGSDDQAFFPATPADIAGALANSDSAPHRARVYPSLGVGVGGGSWGRGVSTGVGVGVSPGAYPRRGGIAGANRRVMEDELRDKSLSGRSLTQPTAGYLYFPITGKRTTHYNLELNRNGETLSLPLPDPNN